MTMTLESLKQAIREATDLRDLKKLVGPSEEDNAAAEARLRRMEPYYSTMDERPLTSSQRRVFEQLKREQRAFEQDYC